MVKASGERLMAFCQSSFGSNEEVESYYICATCGMPRQLSHNCTKYELDKVETAIERAWEANR
jgi:hypothetical protein